MDGRAHRHAPGNGKAPGGSARPTMRDVATRAGVDASTVSRALNLATRHKVSPETVDRVLGAAEGLGYRMNTLARGLRLNRTMAVGMIIPDIANPFFPPVVRGAEDELARAGRTLIMMNTDDDPEREDRAVEQLIERQVDALILASWRQFSEAQRAAGDIPCVLVNREAGSTAIPSVVPDDRRGVRLAMKHLAELGHTRIVHVAGPQDTSTGLVRRRLFLDACQALGVRGEVYQAAAFTSEAGLAAALDALAGSSPTALLAANDLIAIGCLRAARQAGLRVPGELSIVGYNDMPMMDLLDPPLTTVRVPQYRMGVEAARLVLAIIEPDGGWTRRRRVHVRPELVVRASTAPPARSRDERAALSRGGREQSPEISEAVWSRIRPLLADGEEGGRWRDPRQMLEALAWRATTRQPWRVLPERFGPWQTAWKRFDRWSKDGALARLRQAAADDPEVGAELAWLQSVPLLERQRDGHRRDGVS